MDFIWFYIITNCIICYISFINNKEQTEKFKKWSKEDKSLIKNEDGTYSSTSKKEALDYYKKYTNEILSDEEKAKKHREQLSKDIEEWNPIIVTDEMYKSGLKIRVE